MARSYHAIQMDFSKAKRQARELDDVAANLRKLSNDKMELALNQIALNWTGDNSTKYVSKGKTLQGNISNTADALREVAQAIRDIAEVIYEAEMEAWERAQDDD